MMTAPPIFFDPSQVQLNMPSTFYQPPPAISVPMPAQAPATSKAKLLDVLKILIGLLIAIMLCGILVLYLFLPRTSNGVDVRESNEKIAKLLSESNENIARLQREQTLFIEQERQRRQENLMEKHRFEDRTLEGQHYERQISIENQRLERQYNFTEKHRSEDQYDVQRRHEQDLAVTLQISRQQLEIEEKRLKILRDEQNLHEQIRKEDLNKKQADILSIFMEEILSAAKPFNNLIWELKTHSLLLQLDALHKSLLVQFLYKFKFLDAKNLLNTTLNLQGANLNDIRLGSMVSELGEIGRLSYDGLSLPLINLINASFTKIYFNEANFSMSNMAGASFRFSQGNGVDFSMTNLTLARFDNAHVSQSNFENAIMNDASFINANLSKALMNNTKFHSTMLQNIDAFEADFSMTDISSADFNSANLVQANFFSASVRSTTFYSIKGMNANFSSTYLPDCTFAWADLTGASFRNAFLAGTSFENANLEDVDFTAAYLYGVQISQGQLDVVLSIAQAVLPDGSNARNKNLALNSDANCMDMNGTISHWINDGNVITQQVNSSDECVFQGKKVNATLQQTINLRRYKRIIKLGESKIYVEMQEKSANGFISSHLPAYMNLQFFDWNSTQIGSELSLSDITSFIPPSKFIATVPCPLATAELQVTIVFREVNATVDHIYVTIG